MKNVGFLYLTLFLWAMNVQHAHSQSASSDAVKAAYILNFSKYVSIDDSPAIKTEVGLCLIGIDDVGHEIMRLIEKDSDTFDTVIMMRKEPNDSFASCELVYVSARNASLAQSIVYKSEHIQAIAVSSIKGFLEIGGGVELFEENNKIRFSVAKSKVLKRRVSLSAKLLELASEVKD